MQTTIYIPPIIITKPHPFSTSIEYYKILELCNNKEDIPGEAFEQNTASYDWQNYTDFIESTSQSCEAMLLKCTFGGEVIRCSDIFQPIVTDEGFCCVFNTVAAKFMFTRTAITRMNNTIHEDLVPVDWSTERGYPPNIPPNHYPQPGAGPGQSLGMNIVLDADVDDYFCSSTNVAGFKLLLHNPTETPLLKELGLFLPPGQESKFRISAEKIDASPEIRNIKQSRRRCLFNDEGKLLYFRTYSKRNCEMECEAARYIRYCNCIKHYMPRIYRNVSLCNLQDVKCIANIGSASETANQEKTCAESCLPGCFDLTFIPVAFPIPFSTNYFDVSDKFLNKFRKEYAVKNMAIFHFYYKENSYWSNIQSQYIGMTEFLCKIFHFMVLESVFHFHPFFIANIGGLMGLFIGFSFISCAEVFYFATVRVFLQARKQGKVGMVFGNRSIGCNLLLQVVAEGHLKPKSKVILNMERFKTQISKIEDFQKRQPPFVVTRYPYYD